MPRTRYDLANRCLALVSAPTGRVVAGPLYFKPTSLGGYLIHDTDGKLLSVGERDTVTRTALPGPPAEWAASRARHRTFTLRSSATGRLLVAGDDGNLETGPPSRRARFRLAKRRGCRRYP
jgi:hypothetical protein